MKSFLFFTALLTTTLFLGSCSNKSTAAYGKAQKSERNTLELGETNKTLSLKDHLVRFPNLYWDNTRIMLKETASINSQKEPLYIIDGIKVGNDYNKVEGIVDPNDIKSVRVLANASETSFYGLDGINGVIKIKTKK